MLCQLPARITRTKVQAAFGQMAEAERDRLERMFLSTKPRLTGMPSGRGVIRAVRDGAGPALPGTAQAQRCPGPGALMNSSHDGDRVSRETSRDTWRRVPAVAPMGRSRNGRANRGAGADIAELSGEYGCSLPALDALWIARGGHRGGGGATGRGRTGRVHHGAGPGNRTRETC